VLRISVLQPNKRSTDVRWTMLGVVNDHWLLRAGWHEDFDGIVVIAVGALVERALDASNRHDGQQMETFGSWPIALLGALRDYV
jgi:hypothetical protein